MIHLPHAKGITRRSRPEAAESYFRSSALAERVGRLDHVGAAPDRVPRGEQHEAPSREGEVGEAPPHGDVARDVDWRRIAQTREGDVGRELAALRGKADAAKEALLLGLEPGEVTRRNGAGEHGAGTVAAEARE